MTPLPLSAQKRLETKANIWLASVRAALTWSRFGLLGARTSYTSVFNPRVSKDNASQMVGLVRTLKE